MIKQISLFLENKTGRISEVARLLGAHGINMKAFSMTEAPDFGIMHIVVADTERAVQVLSEAHFAVSLVDVVGIECADRPGSMGEVLSHLADAGIGIKYMYAFSEGEKARFVLKPDDIAHCEEVLRQAGCL